MYIKAYDLKQTWYMCRRSKWHVQEGTYISCTASYFPLLLNFMDFQLGLKLQILADFLGSPQYCIVIDSFFLLTSLMSQKNGKCKIDATAPFPHMLSQHETSFPLRISRHHPASPIVLCYQAAGIRKYSQQSGNWCQTKPNPVVNFLNPQSQN